MYLSPVSVTARSLVASGGAGMCVGALACHCCIDQAQCHLDIALWPTLHTLPVS